MIQVNVWLSTTQILGKRIKNRFFGPIFASSDEGENIGHASFLMELNERSRGYAKLDDKSSPFLIKKSIAHVPELVEGKYYKRKTLKSVQVTHSFWPKHPPSGREVAHDFFHFLHLAPKSKGVKPEISDHDSDMLREIIGNGSSIPIKHPTYQENLEKIHKDKSKYVDKVVKVWNLDNDLDNKKNIERNLKALMSKQQALIVFRDRLIEISQIELDALQEKKGRLTDRLIENTHKTIFLSKKLNYLGKIFEPDPKTRDEMKQVMQLLADLQKEELGMRQELTVLEEKIIQTQLKYQEQILKDQEEMERVNKEISLLQSQLSALNERLHNVDETQIEALKSELNERSDFLSRQETFLKNTNLTDGRHPDHSVSLPTSDSGLPYYVDELAVIRAMEKEGNENYALIKNNCAKSVKRCLMAGIDHLKKVLPKSFFKYHPIETTNGIYKWARSLEHELLKLNTKLSADKTSSCPEDHMENDPYSSSNQALVK
ncbi:Uncharacterised protein [Legionella steigerwaltii]|uniref:Uncharacterized protein n=1 Tax=Legionella steigerwaltii TaxID=460 RepID=A0A378L878_9GAMM|nr:hypothetical protein [Legionella steigerwaltii]KTD77723.1 hypothetical protein Lstg_2080 [Legionella steigerwaltii]STY23033.1 Uncharacterised protein [Legionella steigerwaltii]